MVSNLNLNEVFSNVFTKPVVFICGEDENWGGESINLDFLLNSSTSKGSAIQFSYFLNPKQYTINYLQSNLEVDTYKIISAISEIDFNSSTSIRGIFNLIISGFKPSTRLFDNLKGVNSTILIFFNNNLSPFQKEKWKSGFTVKIIEQSIDSYIGKRNHFAPRSLQTYTPSLVSLYGRDKELSLHKAFLLNKEFKGCLITGFKGIGKKTFIKKLLSDADIRYTLKYAFRSNISFSDFLKDFFELLDYTPLNSDIPEEFIGNYVPKSIQNTFELFDKLEEHHFIFENIESLLEKEDVSFSNPSYHNFFLKLINRPSYKGNRIYFISTVIPYLKELNWINVITNIPFYSLGFKSILHILQEKYRNQQEGVKEMKNTIQSEIDFIELKSVTDEKFLMTITGGHPLLAQLAITQNVFIDRSFEQEFLEQKNDFIYSNLLITNEEEALLKFLVQFPETFNIDNIRELQPEPARLTRTLMNKMILIHKGMGLFFIPIFIKAAIFSRMDEKTKNLYKKRHVSSKEKEFNKLQ